MGKTRDNLILLVSDAIIDALTQERWAALWAVFVFPWLLGLFQFGELLGHLAVVVSVLASKHWGW